MKNDKLFLGYLTVSNILSILIGLGFVVLGAFLLLNPKSYDSSATAVISSIEVTGQEWTEDANGFSELRDVYTVYVDYEFNGASVTHAELNEWSSTMKVGDELEIQFNAADTAHVAKAGFSFMPIIFIAAGAAVSAFGVISIVRQPKLRKRQ